MEKSQLTGIIEIGFGTSDHPGPDALNDCFFLRYGKGSNLFASMKDFDMLFFGLQCSFERSCDRSF